MTNGANQLTKPAIGLLVGGIVLGLSALVGTLMLFSAPMYGRGDSAMLLNALFKVNGIVQLILSGIVIFGSVAMFKQSSYGLSMAGSICALIGGFLAIGIGWILVLPFGIWALVVLRKSESKRLFGRT